VPGLRTATRGSRCPSGRAGRVVKEVAAAAAPSPVTGRTPAHPGMTSRGTRTLAAWHR
jgi:hypothetical protein